KGGMYTNGATTPAAGGQNIGSTRSFGGTVYVSTTRTGAANLVSPQSAIGIPATPTSPTLTGLSATVAPDATVTQFYLIQSGTTGSTYDVLYISSGATIKKYSLVSGAWTANGTYTTPTTPLSMIAAPISGGANIFYTTGTTLVKITDTAGFNATINVTTANN